MTVGSRQVVRLRLVVLLIGLLLVGVPSRLVGHEGHALEEDVVCGMKIKREESAGQTDFQGQTFYFCSKEDLATFKANPDRYAGFLALSRSVEGRTYQMAVKPRRPQAGDEITLTLTLPERRWIGVTSEESTSRTTPPLEALFFDLTPDHEELSRSFLHMPAGSSPGVYTMGRYFREPSVVRLVVFVPRGPTVDKVAFGFTVEARAEPAPEPVPMERPASGALTMEAQHETMRVMGRAWYDVMDEIAVATPRWDELARLVQQMRVMAARLPGFELHKFPQQKAEFLRLGQELSQSLDLYQKVVQAKDRDRAHRDAVKIDGQSCTRCHLKFRWGVVQDLTRFPDLRDHAP